MKTDPYSSIWAFIEAGGVVMVPIGIAAVVGLAILIERIVALRYSQIMPEGFAVQCKALIARGSYKDAHALCRESSTPASRLMETALEHRGRSRSAIKERLEEAGRQEAAGMERYTNSLGTVAQATPLMGLLGTVLGMIRTFEDIRSQGQGIGNEMAVAALSQNGMATEPS